MAFKKESPSDRQKGVIRWIKNKAFQRGLIGAVTLLIIFLIVENGAMPKKYRLVEGEKSPYDIIAPRDIENKMMTELNARAAAEAVPPVMIEITSVPIDIINSVIDFVSEVESARKNVEKRLQDKKIGQDHEDYTKILQEEQRMEAANLKNRIAFLGVSLSDEQANYLVSKVSEEELGNFKKLSIDLFSNIMKVDVTEENLLNRISQLQSLYEASNLDQELKNIGGILAKSFLKPNRVEDVERTREAREKEYENAKKTKEIISKDSRIISKGDTVTKDKLAVLEELNLLETPGKVDVVFMAGIFIILLLLALLLVIYMYHFCRDILYSRSDLILLCTIFILTFLIARGVSEYSRLAIPVFMASMMISFLLDLKLAVVTNFILTIALSFIARGDMNFVYVALIGGTFSAFLTAKATQRSRLSMVGVIIGLMNALVIASLGIINSRAVQDIIRDCIIVFLNGIVSVVLTIGLTPFWESTFNVVTPLKLLELTNPNQPLIKRLLMEAPGTYHHSLMAANLAEVATEAIGGDALLARVGAYFHDIGKLKRPNFFRENQLGDNPHDRMTANLSTLVITSHTRDGVELAKKYKIPAPIRDIIMQHHGTTLVVYFYHKAKQCNKEGTVNEENFRYEGPKPTTKEAAVVMLADSVEAAVRSMTDKTEGKIEGLVRKIIKDKLDDGQLDLCPLTLKDLDVIANSFMKVLSGLFHEREKYPEIKVKGRDIVEDKLYDTIKDEASYDYKTEKGKVTNGSIS